jgi:hypothetical protein
MNCSVLNMKLHETHTHCQNILYNSHNFSIIMYDQRSVFFRELDVVCICTCILQFHFILTIINSIIHSAAQTKYCKMLGCQMNNVFKIMYMEAVFAKIEMPSQHFPQGTEKNHTQTCLTRTYTDYKTYQNLPTFSFGQLLGWV